MKLFNCLVVTAVLTIPTVCHAGNAAGVVKDGTDVMYRFKPTELGTVYVDVMWKQAHADVFTILLCTAGNLEITVIGLATENRGTAELATGVLTGFNCILGVSTFDKSAAFTVSLRSSSGESLPIQVVKAGSNSTLEESLREAITELRPSSSLSP